MQSALSEYPIRHFIKIIGDRCDSKEILLGRPQFESGTVQPKALVRVVNTIEFTEDMAKTLSDHFDTYAVDGIVSVEVLDDGSLWLPHCLSGTRQFLGSTRKLKRPDA